MLGCGSSGEESICNVGDLDLIPALGRSPGEGNSYPLQYSGLENSLNCVIHGVAKNQTQLSDLGFTVGFPGGASGKEPACRCRRPKRLRFDL